MKYSLLILFLGITSLTSSLNAQKATEYIIFIIDIERNDDLHPRDIFYWMAESNRLNNEYQFDLAPLILNPFYSAKSYSTCCKSEITRLYGERFILDSTYNFPPNFEDLNKSIKKFLKENAKTTQTIKKKNRTFKLLNEVITVSAIPIRGEFCYCRSEERENFSHIYLPISFPELNPEFWESENSHRALTLDLTSINPRY